MWGRMINRVNGINFTAIYSTTTAVGYRQKITLPEGYTWASYMQFLLGTLPENIRQNYLSKLKVSIKFWRRKRRVSGRVYDREITACRGADYSRRKKQLQDEQKACTNGISG